MKCLYIPKRIIDFKMFHPKMRIFYQIGESFHKPGD